MRNADRGEGARLDGRDLRIGIVQARFNAELTETLARACKAELQALGVARMKLLGSPRRMPSMAGYGLEVTGFVATTPH